jgi:hypothetical protein
MNEATNDLFWQCFFTAEEWCLDRGLESLFDVVSPDDCVLRILRYPPTEDGNVGQAHCDFDLLTVSVPGTCPGLEVWGETSGGAPFWEPRETFEVHVGEMMGHYTRGARTRADPGDATPGAHPAEHRAVQGGVLLPAAESTSSSGLASPRAIT